MPSLRQTTCPVCSAPERKTHPSPLVSAPWQKTGVIAQEVQRIVPEAVQRGGSLTLPSGEEIANVLMVDRDMLQMMTLGGVQQLASSLVCGRAAPLWTLSRPCDGLQAPHPNTPLPGLLRPRLRIVCLRARAKSRPTTPSFSAPS